jgi:hypothetical protein
MASQKYNVNKAFFHCIVNFTCYFLYSRKKLCSFTSPGAIKERTSLNLGLAHTELEFLKSLWGLGTEEE